MAEGIAEEHELPTQTLESPVLPSVARAAYNGEPSETVLGAYEGDRSTIANDDAKALLSLLGIPSDVEASSKATLVQRDFPGMRLVRVESEVAQTDFDEQGNLISAHNLTARSAIDRERRDYGVSQEPSAPAPVAAYDDPGELFGIIDKVQSACRLFDYQVVVCDLDGYGVWTVVWNKLLAEGLLNPYDTVGINIDAADGSITSFQRSFVEPNATEPLLGQQEVAVYAQPVIDALSADSKREGAPSRLDGNEGTSRAFIAACELCIFRPNFLWEEGGPYKPADFVRLAWRVTLGSGDQVYVDARTGEVLGGDQIQALLDQEFPGR
ncbi:MAG: hypothetical protein LBG81_02685 [Coriobacteriaceae bacterium]|nr:hypothetical protein [Coriobacteriaceae bacterium]